MTLRLLGGAHAKPPISYMGSKRGYAHAILAAMGLRSGIGADRVLLCDAGPWAHVWSVLADPERCAEVARILRSWSDEDPRALWDRLRDEYRSEWDDSKIASFFFMQAHQANSKPIIDLGDKWEAIAGNGTPHGIGWWGEDNSQWKPATIDAIARRVESISPPVPLSVYAGPAEDIEPPDDCEGVFMFCDPPYQNTTGYAADMPRETVLEVARRWSDAGAVVCISEAVPLPLDGWHHVEITDARKGQKRTFSKQKREWLTINSEPAEKPVVQHSLFPVDAPAAEVTSTP